jgi:hypothetical protein
MCAHAYISVHEQKCRCLCGVCVCVCVCAHSCMSVHASLHVCMSCLWMWLCMFVHVCLLCTRLFCVFTCAHIRTCIRACMFMIVHAFTWTCECVPWSMCTFVRTSASVHVCVCVCLVCTLRLLPCLVHKLSESGPCLGPRGFVSGPLPFRWGLSQRVLPVALGRSGRGQGGQMLVLGSDQV